MRSCRTCSQSTWRSMRQSISSPRSRKRSCRLTGAVDYASLKTTIDGWYWASRAASLLKQWKFTLPEWDRLRTLTAAAQLLDFLTLPLDSTAAMASIDFYLNASRLLRVRDAFPE